MSTAWLIELLDAERKTFDDDAYPLPKLQADRFDLCCALLKEKGDVEGERSKQRRSFRQKVRALLADIFLNVGREVFLLCCISTTISRLGTVPARHSIIADLRAFSKRTPHPTGLTKVASELCKANSISEVVISLRNGSSPNHGRNSSDTSEAEVHSTILPLTIRGAELILAKLKAGQGEGMTMTLPHQSRWMCCYRGWRMPPVAWNTLEALISQY
jgi:hypothetical protein